MFKVLIVNILGVILFLIGAQLPALGDSSNPLHDYGRVIPLKNKLVPTGLNQHIKRISDYVELSPKSRYGLIVYSRYTPTNVTGEYVIVHHEDSTSASIYRVSDAKYMGVLKRDYKHPIGEVNEIRWDYSGKFPNRVYFVYKMGFYQMDVLNENGAPQLIYDFSKDFPGADKIINDVEGDSSNDSRYWAWQVLGKYENGSFPVQCIFTFDKNKNAIIAVLRPEHVGHRGSLPKPNMVEISPLGTKVITHYGAASTRPVKLPNLWSYVDNGLWVLENYRKYTSGNNVFGAVFCNNEVLSKGTIDKSLDFSKLKIYQYAVISASGKFYVKLPDGVNPNTSIVTANWGKRPEDVGGALDAPHAWDLDFTNPVVVSADETHSGWAFDTLGQEWFVSQNNKTDWLEARNIKNGKSINIINHAKIGWNNGFHFMKPYNDKYNGWILFNTTSKTNTTIYSNKIIAAQLMPVSSNSKILILADKYTVFNGKYRYESPVALSYDGSSFWYTANWGILDNTANVYQQSIQYDFK